MGSDTGRGRQPAQRLAHCMAKGGVTSATETSGAAVEETPDCALDNLG